MNLIYGHNRIAYIGVTLSRKDVFLITILENYSKYMYIDDLNYLISGERSFCVSRLRKELMMCSIELQKLVYNMS